MPPIIDIPAEDIAALVVPFKGEFLQAYQLPVSYGDLVFAVLSVRSPEKYP